MATTASIVVADQVTKWWALRVLDERTIDLVWTLRLRLVFNRGTAFGLGSGYASLLAVLAVVVVVVMLRAIGARPDRWPRVGVALVVGGAVGNLLDRLLRADGGLLGGAVVDFIDLQWWPVFNVADMAITGGAVVLALTAWREPEVAGEGGGARGPGR